MGIYVRGNPKEGEYKFIKTTDGFVLEGEDIAYVCIEIDLIRCGECNYYNGHEEYCEIDHFARENGFCSSGKRKADYTIFTVNPPKGIEIPLKGDATVSHKNSKMGEKVARPTATSSTEVPWWMKGE